MLWHAWGNAHASVMMERLQGQQGDHASWNRITVAVTGWVSLLFHEIYGALSNCFSAQLLIAVVFEGMVRALRELNRPMELRG